MAPDQGTKRKGAPGAKQPSRFSGRNAKRIKAADARSLLAQSGDKAFNDKGELDVGAFVKSREFEIKALEDGIKSSKHGLMSRAFQEVPRELRRRTASHNVKKVPRRLRVRAAKEMKEDNTPTGSARNKQLTSKQRLRKETAKKAAHLGAKSKYLREGLSKEQDSAAKAGRKGVPPSEEDTKTVSFNKGHEAPASINPIRPPNPTKGVLSKAPKPVSKFRKRQTEKTWLPTHMFHAKRAHMTLPSEPLWRFSLPLSSTEKVYRTTHRAANTRGCVAWDMSYMGTIMLEGVEPSLLGTLRGLGVPEDILTGQKGTDWRTGTKSWQGWLRERDRPHIWLAKSTIIWCPLFDEDVEMKEDGTQLPARRRQALLRVHPAAFLQLWNQLLKLTKMQKPTVSMEDLRYDIGSIDVEGPASAEALVGVLHPVQLNASNDSLISTASILSALAKTTNPASCPSNVVLNFSVTDPRLRHPPRPIDLNETTDDALMELLANWHSGRQSQPAPLFDRKSRFAADRLQSSQKAINRRRGDAEPGSYPEPLNSDPQIPVLLCATQPHAENVRQNTWTLMIPWNWVQPVWYSLVYFPVSTGGNPRFGGLDEKRQLSFEQNLPFYPVDFVGTQAGLEWEARENEIRKKDWEKRPKGKRIEWSSLDLGRGKKGEIGKGWACDWEFLFRKDDPQTKMTDFVNNQPEDSEEKQSARPKMPLTIDHVCQILPHQLASLDFKPSAKSILTVSLVLIQRGVPATCARIYRLPSEDGNLRSRWLSMLQKAPQSPTQRQLLPTRTQSRATGDGVAQAGSDSYPPVPGEEDLIGFVTTGNFNLGKGTGTGVGCIALQRVWSQNLAGKNKMEGICIVRNSGNSLGRLAKWTSV